MRYAVVLDRSLVFRYLSGTSPGVPHRSEFLGTCAESWYTSDSEIADFRKTIADCRRYGHSSIAMVWTHPRDDSVQYYYYARYEYVGGVDCHIVVLSWEFPVETLGLTHKELQVVGEIGAGNDPKDIARTMGVRVFTIYKRINRIKEKLSLGNDADLFDFCGLYVESRISSDKRVSLN